MNLRCPQCGIPVAWHHNPYRPFCSERCRLLDLEAWMSERYRIPIKSDEDIQEGPRGDQAEIPPANGQPSQE
ncbi:MAG: DNA gyrase inhibitor YacG [Nitrospirae bacterium]|nr:MAG: DNA gyrase inhibitor YacG [Nitrospirota bacterium]